MCYKYEVSVGLHIDYISTKVVFLRSISSKYAKNAQVVYEPETQSCNLFE